LWGEFCQKVRIFQQIWPFSTAHSLADLNLTDQTKPGALLTATIIQQWLQGLTRCKKSTEDGCDGGGPGGKLGCMENIRKSVPSTSITINMATDQSDNIYASTAGIAIASSIAASFLSGKQRKAQRAPQTGPENAFLITEKVLSLPEDRFQHLSRIEKTLFHKLVTWLEQNAGLRAQTKYIWCQDRLVAAYIRT